MKGSTSETENCFFRIFVVSRNRHCKMGTAPEILLLFRRVELSEYILNLN